MSLKIICDELVRLVGAMGEARGRKCGGGKAGHVAAGASLEFCRSGANLRSSIRYRHSFYITSMTSTRCVAHDWLQACAHLNIPVQNTYVHMSSKVSVWFKFNLMASRGG